MGLSVVISETWYKSRQRRFPHNPFACHELSTGKICSLLAADRTLHRCQYFNNL